MARQYLKIGDLCPKGHLVTEDTAYVYPPTAKLAGRVICKICRMNWQRTRQGKPISDSIGVWNRDKTHCAKGHEYTSDNTMLKNDGSRGCKTCHSRRMRKANYGIEWEQFESMWASQSGTCAICSTKFTSESDAHVDHSHDTDVVRGLLCNNCNNGLGRFKDNIQYLQSAINYLSGNI